MKMSVVGSLLLLVLPAMVVYLVYTQKGYFEIQDFFIMLVLLMGVGFYYLTESMMEKSREPTGFDRMMEREVDKVIEDHDGGRF